MLENANIVSFVATTDGKSARAFYEGVLGLRVVSDDEFATVFDANGTELRIQKVKTLEPHAHTALGWSVTSIDKLIAEFRTRGAEFERFPSLQQNVLGIWTSPSGAKIAWLKDPDGNLISLTQSMNA